MATTKKKSFKDQLRPILEERFKNSPIEGEVDRQLELATTPSAETLITYIRQWKFQSGQIALGRLLECDRWNKKGELVLEKNFKGKPYPFQLPLAIAWDWYMYGYQGSLYIPNYSFPNCLKRIPDNMTDDWANEIKDLFGEITRTPIGDVKLIILGQCVKSYKATNPHCITWWNRQVEEFIAAQKAVDEFVKNRKGWEHLTVENSQNPKHKLEMSKVLTDILVKADELVEPAIARIKESDRKLYARQDATYARNNIKTLRGFFKKYGNEDATKLAGGADLLDTLGLAIDAVESNALNP